MAKQVVLTRFLDEGIPKADNFAVCACPAPSECGENQCLVKLLYLSPDPYMRFRMKHSTEGHMSSFEVNKPIEGFVVAEVLQSKVGSFTEGDLLGGLLPFVTVQALDEKLLQQVWKLNDYLPKDKASYGVGALGMTGLTAYFGLYEVLRPKAGESLYVNSAAGAVGSMVGEIAKLIGCEVIGSAGGDKKCERCVSLGFDDCVNYKTCKSAHELRELLKSKFPKGIDMYYENVGGMQFDAVFPLLNEGGRIAVCGCLEHYNKKCADDEGCWNLFSLAEILTKRLRIEGFTVLKYLPDWEKRDKALRELSGWIRDGKIKVEETIVDGVDNFGEAFSGLFKGSACGKIVVKV